MILGPFSARHRMFTAHATVEIETTRESYHANVTLGWDVYAALFRLNLDVRPLRTLLLIL